MKNLIFIAFLLLTSVGLQAQTKSAHINLGNLISEMPEAIAANSELEAYQGQLISKGEDMAKAFETDYIAFANAVQSGSLPPVEQQQQQQTLEAKQQEILAYEQQIIQLVDQKRAELLSPIIKKAQDAIDAVAKEQSIQLVFDTSIFGTIMYAADSEDIMPLVKAKLGMN